MSARAEEMLGTIIGLCVSFFLLMIAIMLVTIPFWVPLWMMALR
jgi:uncharacterized membrane protein (DUF106 family)